MCHKTKLFNYIYGLNSQNRLSSTASIITSFHFSTGTVNQDQYNQSFQIFRLYEEIVNTRIVLDFKVELRIKTEASMVPNAFSTIHIKLNYKLF